MNRFFSSTTFIIPLILAPFTGLLILSQNTVPGDLLYAYKRGVEIMILSAASLHPETRVAFRTDLTERRFNEAETLLLAKQDVSTLETFLQEVRETETAIANVSDVKKKEDLNQTLIAKIDDYQTRLIHIETQVTNQQIDQQQEAGMGEASQTAAPQEAQPTSLPRRERTQLSVSQATPTFQPARPTPTSIRSEPTHVLQPTLTPVLQQPIADTVGDAIDQAKEELERIKERSKREHREEKESEDKDEDRGKNQKVKQEDGDKKEDNKRGKQKD